MPRCAKQSKARPNRAQAQGTLLPNRDEEPIQLHPLPRSTCSSPLQHRTTSHSKAQPAAMPCRGQDAPHREMNACLSRQYSQSRQRGQLPTACRWAPASSSSVTASQSLQGEVLGGSAGHNSSTPRCRQRSPGRTKAEQMKQPRHTISHVQCDRWMGRQLALQSTWLAAAPATTAVDHFTGNGSSSWVW